MPNVNSRAIEALIASSKDQEDLVLLKELKDLELTINESKTLIWFKFSCEGRRLKNKAFVPESLKSLVSHATNAELRKLAIRQRNNGQWELTLP